MQSGGGASGRGLGPAVAPPPPGRSSSSSSASPSSSSSAVSAPRVGFESLKQQLAWRQSLQQQQIQHLRKPEEGSLMTNNVGAVQGVVEGGTFPSSSGAPALQSPMLPLDNSRQLREVKQQSEHCQEQPRNHMPQAYVQFAMQAAQQQQRSQENIAVPQGGKFGIMGPPLRDQEMHVNNFKMQELTSIRGNQTQAFRFTNSAEQAGQHHRNNKLGNAIDVQKNEMKPNQSANRQFTTASMIRPMQSQQLHGNMGSIANNQLMIAQLQAMQTWAMERNIDLTHPANANLLAQFLPILHSNRLPVMQKPNASVISAQNSNVSTSKPEVISSPVNSENSAQGNSMTSQPGQDGRTLRGGVGSNLLNSNNIQAHQPLHGLSSAKQNERGEIPGVAGGSSAFSLHQLQHQSQGSVSPSQTIDLPSAKNNPPRSDSLQIQFLKQSQRTPLSPSPLSDAARSQVQVQGGAAQIEKQHIGFTKQQLHVLKAQILAFRRLKRGERALPPEVLQAISPPPLESQVELPFLPSGANKPEKIAGQIVGEHERRPEKSEAPQLAPPSDSTMPKLLPTGDEKVQQANLKPTETVARREFSQTASAASSGKVKEAYPVSVKSEHGVDEDSSLKCGNDAEKGKSPPLASVSVDSGHMKQFATTNVNDPSKNLTAKKYHGPLFDFPAFIRKYDVFGLTAINNSINLALAYDIKELLLEEGKIVLSKKRAENMKKISNLLSFNLERRRIRPDIVLRLQIEEKKLRLLDIQASLRDAVDEQQQEIMAMPDRPYRKFVRQCERQRTELLRHVQQLQKATREKQLKSIFLWRKKLLETHWSIRDARTTRNRGVAKYHEKMLREFSKRKDDDHNKRMEALKNNDVDRYREMLLEQQTSITGDGAQRYAVLSSFLSQTEEYLHKLGAKITTTKKQQDLEEAANAAANAARSQGLSEEEVKAAAACAREEVMIRNTFSEMNAPRDRASVNKYYNLAHAVNERVVRQPSMLRAGTLRDYQLVGLQWMLSLYNNKLNGILADEMGLGKTVQVMALIAYLMEFKGNYGPHLIIVPNAVLVNWKSELHNWLPSVSCIFYVGIKEERSRLFSHEVCAMKYNVLVTTYEFIMYDRSKLSRIDWKYIIIDEAQRMKDRESVLARDLDRYRCQRRLLLTGTPLQNDLKELWSLLNLLLPEVFDNRKAFHDWFSKPFQKDGSSHSPEEDDWLETEKKVIVIHRLHQILEPFMLRRRVEDVEGSLPAKVSVVLRCRMSAMQGAIYDWIKSTGTIRVDPEDELRRSERNPMYQIKMYKNLNNKCMELRKACNHPLLNYPYFSAYSKDFLVRSCGKLWILDRILLKLQRAGHRVLLFSTMTKLLDILEEYLQWRRLVYRRIDGTTSLEDRESAIVDFNSPYSDCFIFLLSIRAAGRGLNLQSADTVVIYDPDPNPQNEEQAVARAHRIGQTREVKVIYMEAVVDKISSYQKEDELRSGGSGDSEDDLAGKDRYMGSVESLIRNQIQQYKIDMADEVINAGRFDQRTTHEERRMTLETLLHDEERYQETVHDVPSLQEVNRMIARSEEEVELFDQMDEELNWTGELMKHTQVPKWLRVCSKELNTVVSSLSKKPSKNILSSVVDFESSVMTSGLSSGKAERKRGQTRALTVHKYSSYIEFDEDEGEGSEASSEEGNVFSSREEDRGIGEVEEEDLSGAGDQQAIGNQLLEDEGTGCDGDGYEYSHAMEGRRHTYMSEEAGSIGSSFVNRRGHQPTITSTSLNKFGSLTELAARPGVLVTKSDELEEGEIAVSGDSHVDIQQSGSWNHEHDDGQGEQVLQPKLKRKRSIRPRPIYAIAKLEARSDRSCSQRRSQPLFNANHKDEKLSRIDTVIGEPSGFFPKKQDTSPSLLKKMNSFPTRGVPVIKTQKSGGSKYVPDFSEDAVDCSRESWTCQTNANSVGHARAKMSDSMQRKCKNVINKLQRRIDKEGCLIAPVIYDIWKTNDPSNLASKFSKMNNPFDLLRIDQRIESLEYEGVADFIEDVQSLLKNVVHYCKYSQEVKYEARKLHDIFFDIMKIAFPDSDFREAKMALTFPSPSQGGLVPRQGMKPCSLNLSKQPKAFELERDHSPPPKPMTRTPTPKPMHGPRDQDHSWLNASKFEKESRQTPRSRIEPDGSLYRSLLTHPGDLVICKKKRKDRDKSMTKPRMGPLSPVSQGRASPFSPRTTARAGLGSPVGAIRGGPLSPARKVLAHPTQNSVGWVHSAMEEVQWARPVKRMRTDTGKRRPIQF